MRMFLSIDLQQLRPHPRNANVMPERLLAKLEAHIRAGGNYPALIVRALPPPPQGVAPPGDRPHDSPAGPLYQVLDGHHRLIVLRRLGHRAARCEVWQDIDDRAAGMLLLTLNRLRGEDDPLKRGGLLRELADGPTPGDLARLLPEDAGRIERLMALCQPPATPRETQAVEDLPQGLTFFVSAAARREILARLREIDTDRSRALLRALGIALGIEGVCAADAGAAPVIAATATEKEKAPHDNAGLKGVAD
jgi:hypothetical protein